MAARTRASRAQCDASAARAPPAGRGGREGRFLPKAAIHLANDQNECGIAAATVSAIATVCVSAGCGATSAVLGVAGPPASSSRRAPPRTQRRSGARPGRADAGCAGCCPTPAAPRAACSRTRPCAGSAPRDTRRRSATFPSRSSAACTPTTASPRTSRAATRSIISCRSRSAATTAWPTCGPRAAPDIGRRTWWRTSCTTPCAPGESPFGPRSARSPATGATPRSAPG